jgi:hypothetical protein
MNIHVQPGISRAAPSCLFSSGDIVRIGKSESVGRVVEAQGNRYSVRIFGELGSVFGEENSNATFTPDCLEIWMPTSDRLVVVPLAIVAPVAAPSDAGELMEQTFKILQACELIGTLVQTAVEKDALDPTVNHEHEAFLNNVGFVASMAADMTCHLLDNLPSVSA